jgi:hypothetical protein
MLRFGVVGTRRLVVVSVLPAYGNWLITVIKSFVHVKGVDLTGDQANDVVFAALNAVVVIPSFAAAIGWTYGLLGERPNV